MVGVVVTRSEAIDVLETSESSKNDNLKNGTRDLIRELKELDLNDNNNGVEVVNGASEKSENGEQTNGVGEHTNGVSEHTNGVSSNGNTVSESNGNGTSNHGEQSTSNSDQETSIKNGENKRQKKRIGEIEPTNKLFVGGLRVSITNEELRKHFQQFGNVVDAVVKEQRGFGFVTFETIDEANIVLEIEEHKMEDENGRDKPIDVKRAIANRYPNERTPRQYQNSNPQWQNRSGSMEIFTPQQIMHQSPQGFIYSPAMEYPVPPPPHTHPINPQIVSSEYISEHERSYQEQQEKNQKRKLFVGGLHWKTADSDLTNYFGTLGTVTDAMVIMEPNTMRSRGFGFVVFGNQEDAENVVKQTRHVINGKEVEVKRAISKELMPRSNTKPDFDTENSPNFKKSAKPKPRDDENADKQHIPVDKIFVGGLRRDTTKNDVKSYFQEKFPNSIVEEIEMQFDDEGRNKGYAFVTFDSTEVVEPIVAQKFHRVNQHMVEVKKAFNKYEKHPSNNNNENKQPKGYPYSPRNSTIQHYATYSSYPAYPDVYYSHSVPVYPAAYGSSPYGAPPPVATPASPPIPPAATPTGYVPSTPAYTYTPFTPLYNHCTPIYPPTAYHHQPYHQQIIPQKEE